MPGVDIPKDFRGIPFQTWLDIFLEYALCLARNGKKKASYEICEAAKDAVVFCHSREDMFLIQLCYCSKCPDLLRSHVLTLGNSVCSDCK